MDQERPPNAADLQEPLLSSDHRQEEADEIPPPGNSISISTASDGSGSSDTPSVGTPSCSPRSNSTSTSTSVPLSQQPQDGGWCDSCCGCGYREAVIVVAILRLLFASICIFVLVADFKATTSISSSGEEDDSVDVMVNNGPIAYPAFLVGILILTSMFSWVGALRYNLWLIAISVLWLVGTYQNL